MYTCTQKGKKSNIHFVFTEIITPLTQIFTVYAFTSRGRFLGRDLGFLGSKFLSSLSVHKRVVDMMLITSSWSGTSIFLLYNCTHISIY